MFPLGRGLLGLFRFLLFGLLLNATSTGQCTGSSAVAVVVGMRVVGTMLGVVRMRMHLAACRWWFRGYTLVRLLACT